MSGHAEPGRSIMNDPPNDPTFSTPGELPTLRKEGSDTLSSSQDGDEADINQIGKVDGDTGRSRVHREDLLAEDDRPLKRKTINGQKAHLKGRFSGRLETKDDEKRLVEECRLTGPLLGGIGKRGERSRMSLAKIVRGLATGEIRNFLETRERHIQELTVALKVAQAQINELKTASPNPSGLLARMASVAPSSSGGGSAPAGPANKDIPAFFSPSMPPPDDSIAAIAAPLIPDGHLNPTMPAQAQEHNKHAVLLKLQAVNFQAHADHLEEEVRRQPSPSRHTVVQAQKYLAKARSLEAAAAAHSLQARAVVHAESRAQMEALAQNLAQQAKQQRLDLARVAERRQQQVSALGPLGGNGQSLQREFVEQANVLQDNILMLDREAEARKEFALEHLTAQESAQADAQCAVVTAQQMDAQAKSLDERERSLQLAYMNDNISDPIANVAGNIAMSAQPSSAGLLDMRDAEAEFLERKRKRIDGPEQDKSPGEMNPLQMAYSRHLAGHNQNALDHALPANPIPTSFC